eukprot:37349-Prorocentrum_minimum.AAC.1
MMIDAAGACCASGSVDTCGVCGGDGTSCATRVTVGVLTLGPTAGLDNSSSVEYSDFSSKFAASVAAELGVGEENVLVTSVSIIALRRRALLQVGVPSAHPPHTLSTTPQCRPRRPLHTHSAHPPHPLGIPLRTPSTTPPRTLHC